MHLHTNLLSKLDPRELITQHFKTNTDTHRDLWCNRLLNFPTNQTPNDEQGLEGTSSLC